MARASFEANVHFRPCGGAAVTSTYCCPSPPARPLVTRRVPSIRALGPKVAFTAERASWRSAPLKFWYDMSGGSYAGRAKWWGVGEGANGYGNGAQAAALPKPTVSNGRMA